MRAPATRSVGAGDACPVNREHGRMLVLSGNVTQYCPDQSHDGRGKHAVGGSAPATRKLWPMQFFDRAVKEYTALTAGEAVAALPDVDLEGFDA